MIKYFIPIIAIPLCGAIGFFAHSFPLRLPTEIALPMILGIILLAILMQTILLQRVQINQLKQRHAPEQKPVIDTTPEVITIADVAERLHDQEAFKLSYLGIKDIQSQKIQGDYARIDFLPTPQGAPVAIETLASDPKANSQHIMMLLAQMLLLLNKHDTGRSNLFCNIPIAVLSHRLLAASLQQMAKIWQRIAPRCVFVFKAKDLDSAISGLETLHQDGARFGLEWHENLLEADCNTLHNIGVRFVHISFAALVALQQDAKSATAFADFSSAMTRTSILWIVQDLNDLTPTQPLVDQGITLVLHQEV